MSRKTIVTAVGSAVLGGLAVGYLTVGPMASAGRSSIIDDPTTTAAAVTDPDAPSETVPTADPAPDDVDDRYRDHVREALAPLVANGTLTEAEVEQIIDALATARPERPMGPRGHGRGGKWILGDIADVVAGAIGITTEQLREELQTQGTIAAVATAHGVAPQTVIDALVADATARIDARVAAGEITAERAAEIKANLVERTTNFVNETPKRPGHRHGPPPSDATPEDDGGS
jgi:hypothetical protein